MAELTVFVVTPAGVPLTSPGDLPEIQIRRVDTQAIVQAFTAMTEIGDGMYSFNFAPSATLDYTFTVDADPSVTGQASPRYFGGSISGPANDAVLNDIPAILVDTDTTIPGLIAVLNDISVADILTAVLAGSGESVDTALSRLDNIDTSVTTTIPGLIAALNDISVADIMTFVLGSGESVDVALSRLDNIDADAATAAAGVATILAAIAALNDPTAAAIADAVWDENIVAAHGTASTAGLLLRVLGAAISTRVNNPTLNALLGVADVAARDLPEQVDIELTAAHGAGAWTTAAGSQDWTAAEREQIRFRLAMDGTQTDPTTNTGTIEDILADTAAVDARLPSDPADESLQQASHTATQAAIAALNDLSQADVQSAMTAQGYTVARAGNLDNLDATISSVNTAIAALNDISIADVQTAMTAQGYTAARAPNLDNLDATITSVLAAIAALNDPSAATIATAVRDVALVGSAVGSLGAAIQVVLGISGKANAVWDNFSYNASTQFLDSCRVRIFATSGAASAATPGAADGADGEIFRINLTSNPDGTFPGLPADILGVLT